VNSYTHYNLEHILTYSLQVRVGVEEGTLEQREDTIVVAGTAIRRKTKNSSHIIRSVGICM
jgi:hypothetical protein